MSMGSDFERAFDYTLLNEGLFVNDPADPGGATKYGITQATLSRWRGYSVSTQAIMDLQKPEAGQIYFEYYWKPLCCPYIDSIQISTALFDCGVLFGVNVTTLFTQKALVENGYEKLTIDGHIGPQTLLALNEINPALFLRALHLQFLTRIADIIASRPRSIKYRNGWEKRITRFLSLVA